MNDPVIVNHLKRINDDITEILAKYSHVALYRLRRLDVTEEWEREQFEGSFYVFKKNPVLPAHQRYGMCILNRLSTSDAVEDVTQTFEFEFRERFMIYRRGAEIRAIWFADDADSSSSTPEGAREGDGGEGGGGRTLTNFDVVKACMERIKREITSIPPTPLHSLPRRRDPQTGYLTKEEMRDAVLRLMNDSKFVDTLYSQLLATEERRRRNASSGASNNNPITNLISTPAAYQQQQQPMRYGGMMQSPPSSNTSAPPPHQMVAMMHRYSSPNVSPSYFPASPPPPPPHQHHYHPHAYQQRYPPAPLPPNSVVVSPPPPPPPPHLPQQQRY